MPQQLAIGLADLHPTGPWTQMAALIPAVVRASAPRGFVSDWSTFTADEGFMSSPVGSYDAIRVYLWAGMLDAESPGREAILRALPGMAGHLRVHDTPPAKVKADAVVEDAKGPVGFSAALLPYLSALGEDDLARAQEVRVRSERNVKTGLYGQPARSCDQNLGPVRRRFQRASLLVRRSRSAQDELAG